MCQIMYIKSKNIKKLMIDDVEKIEKIMFSKGERYNISGIFFNKNIIEKFNFSNRDEYITFFKKFNIFKKMDQVILFSRQAPEMENIDDTVERQPYYNSKMKRYFFVHGTIYNDKELSEKYNKKINVDTEILKYINQVGELKGLYSYISVITVNNYNSVIFKNVGLGLWEFCSYSIFNNESDRIVITENIDNMGRMILKKDSLRHNMFVAYSGGMDITLSVCKLLNENSSYRNIYLNYFDFGTNSKNLEIESLNRFKEYIEKKYPNIKVYTYIRDDEYFKQYFKLIKSQPKLTQKNVSADSNEAEEAITYVPYRNSQFVLLMGALCEKMNLFYTDIVLGLNLSEGMVYGDNAEPWLESVDKMVKFGGKDPKQNMTFNVIAPYFRKTKTNMIKDFINNFGIETFNEVLDITTSCYYPIDGKPCNKCGSCRLRNLAIERATKS